jgi:hypothetical protein
LRISRFVIALIWLIAFVSFGQRQSEMLYLKPSLTSERCATDHISRMTLEEKVLPLQSAAPILLETSTPIVDPRLFVKLLAEGIC